jgi:hypothetical protein
VTCVVGFAACSLAETHDLREGEQMKSVTIAILALAAVILIEGERLNHTLDGLDDPFYQHDIRLMRGLLPGQEK